MTCRCYRRDGVLIALCVLHDHPSETFMKCPCGAPRGDRLADGRCAVCGRMPGESEAA